MKSKPPRYPLRFLRWFCREDYLDEVEGDLTELFEKNKALDPGKARWIFAFRILHYLRPEYMKLFQKNKTVHSSIPMSMIRNYITLAFRNLRKRATFSLINTAGLALGVGACLVILNYIEFETSFDNFHAQGPSIFRINRTFTQGSEKMPAMVMTTYGLGPALTAQIPEIKSFIRTHDEESVITYVPSVGEPRAFREIKIKVVDSTFFRVFTFKSIEGNLILALDNPNSIVLTQSTARKYFGGEDPIGKTLRLAGGRMDGDYTVTAIMEDVPQNSHFDFDMLLPMHNIFLSRQYKEDDGWAWNNFATYVLLNKENNQFSAEEKLPDFCKRNLDPKWKEVDGHLQLHLQPLLDIHMNTGLRHDVETVSRGTIYFFGVIAAFILFIAWINYINLSTARAMERSREVGIKKTIGAARSELVVQFLFESVLINFIGIVLAVGLAVFLLSVMSGIIGKELSFNFADARLWLILAALFGVGTIASGTYPALVMSSFRITSVLKGHGQQTGGLSLRKMLVVFQFSASLILIAGTFLVYRQINFMQSQDKGLLMDQMLVVSGPGTLDWRDAIRRLTLFKEEARKIPGVTAVATSAAIPGGGHNWGADIRKSGAPATAMKLGSVVWIDPDFIPTYQMTFIAGKNFDLRKKSDMESVIINEASLAAFGLGTAEQALNEQILMGSDTLPIIGVLKNYNWSSLKSEFVPFVFRADTVAIRAVSLHLEGQSIPPALDAIAKLYKDLIPSDPFEYRFLDDSFNAQYKSDRQFGNIFGLFAGLAVAISCLGLWGLASFTTSQRLGEIGVRKVLGASVGSIVYLLCRQFLQLVMVSALFALPLAWYGMSRWLNGFAFRIGLEWDLFVLPVFLLVLISLLTVSVQVLKGAATNPATVLRSE